MQTFADIIALWDPLENLAADLGVEASHVRTMKARNSIAPEHWTRLIEGAQRRGLPPLTYETLVLAYSNRHVAKPGLLKPCEASP